MFQAKREFIEKYGTVPPRYASTMDLRNDYDSIIPGRRLKTALPR